MNSDRDLLKDLFDIVLRDISKFELALGLRIIDDYALKNKELLGVLKSRLNPDFDYKKIEDTFKLPVSLAALSDYRWIVKMQPLTMQQHYLDNKHFLAYAIKENVLSSEQIRKINFDKGESALGFVEKFYEKNLFSDLRERLFNPKDESKDTSLQSKVNCCSYRDLNPGC